MFVRIQKEHFLHDELVAELIGSRTDVGAVASFTGLVRDFKPVDNGTQKISQLELEHYPELAQTQLENLAKDATSKFDILDIGIIHRYGKLKPADPIVLVIALSAHRQPAFDAAQMVMDGLKVGAPFWKKEIGPDLEEDQSQWVSTRDIDLEAAQKWTE